MEGKKNSGLGIASLILGIIGIAIIWIPFVSFVGMILGILALIFGAIAFFGKTKDKLGLAGFILGIIILVLAIVAIALTTYVYVSGMVGAEPLMTPDIICDPNNDDKTLTIIMVDDGNYGQISWSEIEVIGTCDTSSLGFYVEAGEKITNCEGEIMFKHIPTNTILGRWTFY